VDLAAYSDGSLFSQAKRVLERGRWQWGLRW